jgi:predicted Zn-dependent protease
VTDDPVRQAIEEAFVIERQGWASERVGRVTERLQRDVPAAERLETLVVWLDDHNAFTVQGRTIYISRRLLERLADDDAAAFVIAHELAHHRLGHIPALPRSWLVLARLPMIWLQQLWITTQAREHDADLLAIERCVDAGYDAERCIAALQLLAQVSLDYGDIDGVLGAEGGSDAKRTHPALQARIAAVRGHLAAMQRGARLPLDVTIQRERRRRRRIAIAAAGGAAAMAAFLVLRRPPRW